MHKRIRIYSIGPMLSATLNGASVLALISSTVTPSANSIRVSPSVKSTSNTHYEGQHIRFSHKGS